MRYAIVSDLHSNLEAVRAVFCHIDSQKVDTVICLGDIVGYGGSPKEVLDIVRARCPVVIAGNHDHAVVGKTDRNYFNPSAKTAVEWTAKQLSEDDFKYICELPFIVQKDNFICVHANLNDPEKWNYVLDEFDASATFAKMDDAKVCFIGHSHVPIVFEDSTDIHYFGVSYFGPYTELKLNPAYRYIVNVGSVGQPRDGVADAAYVVYDSTSMFVQLFRVPYDIASAQKQILSASLPKFLAERIQYGR
jgi:predicted phosphodiesterase